MRQIPSLEQGLGGNCKSQIMYLRQNFEAAIENQPGLRIAPFHCADRSNQTGFLSSSFLGRLGINLIGIERIQKKIPIAGIP